MERRLTRLGAEADNLPTGGYEDPASTESWRSEVDYRAQRYLENNIAFVYGDSVEGATADIHCQYDPAGHDWRACKETWA